MQRVEAYRVEIPIVATDEYSREMEKAGKAIDDTNRKVTGGKKVQDDYSKSAQNVAKAQDNVAKSTRNASKGFEEAGKSAGESEKRVSRATKTFESFGNKVKSLQRAKATVELAVKDGASRILDRVQGTWNSFRRNPVTRLTVFAVDRAMRVLRGIKNTVLSIPTLITIGLSYVGIKNLSQATVGAAMNWEQYEVSMEHWLDGNTKKAKELTKWMGEFADITPFSSPELFPALTRGIGVSNGDIKQAKEMLKISADMAALTPGSSVTDAMEALADAQMGEMERLKAFNVKLSKKEFNKIGYAGVLQMLAEKFEGGAEKLSKTAAGVIATLKGYRGSFMRSMGTGFLEPMKPRLDAINRWLGDNQDTWGRWKKTVRDAGEEFSEFVFSRGERGFKYLSNVLAPKRTGDVWAPALADAGIDPDMSFTAKLKIVYADAKGAVGKWWSDSADPALKDWWSNSASPALTDWWEGTGRPWAVELGNNIGSGVYEGIKTALKAGAGLLSSSYEDLYSNFKETGFSKETGKSALGAMATTAGALFLGKRFIYNPGKEVFRGGKKAAGWAGDATKWTKKHTPKRKTKPKKVASSKRMLNAEIEMETARKYSQTPQAYRPPKDAKSVLKIASGGTASGGLLKGIGSKIPLLRTGLAAFSLGSASEEEMPGIIGSLAGGLAGAKGGALAGAAIGSVVPGIGTAIGGTAGGIIGGIGGAVGGEWIGENWDTIKEKAAETSVWIGTKLGEAQVTASKTILNGEWWGQQWGVVKSTASNTLFNAEWWGEQAGFVWGTLENTLFNGEWWGGKWDGVKGWTSEKWNEWTDIYDDAKNKISETIFNGEWWSGKWTDVKTWTKDTTDGFADAWENAKAKASETLFNSEWWSGKWGQVKSWATGAWENITSGFQVGRNKANKKSGQGVTAYARGGIATSPHIGLVGEAGVNESMIPWDGSARSKSIWMQTGEALGMFGGNTSASNDVATVGGGMMAINIGDINVDGGSSMSADEIMNMIMPALYEKIVAAIAKR